MTSLAVSVHGHTVSLGRSHGGDPQVPGRMAAPSGRGLGPQSRAARAFPSEAPCSVSLHSVMLRRHSVKAEQRRTLYPLGGALAGLSQRVTRTISYRALMPKQLAW